MRKAWMIAAAAVLLAGCANKGGEMTVGEWVGLMLGFKATRNRLEPGISDDERRQRWGLYNGIVYHNADQGLARGRGGPQQVHGSRGVERK
jgi:hypothetical protein